MADEPINNTPDFSKIISDLISNQDIMSKINEITDTLPAYQDPNASVNSSDTPNIDSLFSNPDIISKLPEVINVIKPIMNIDKAPTNQTVDKRMGLLIAMKPYLSPKRCEAIDYIARMSKLSEIIKSLKL